MFLATTAISEFWNEDGPLALLGAWCATPATFPILKARGHEVLPCPWDDRERLARACRFVSAFYEKALVSVADVLASHSGLTWPLRSWRILIGPWLMHHIHVHYDRWICLTEAERRYPKFDTVVMAESSFRRTRDYADLSWSSGQDAYNLQVFSGLLRGFGRDHPSRRYERGPAGTVSTSGREWKPRVAAALARAPYLLFGKASIGLSDLHLKTPLVFELVQSFKGKAAYLPAVPAPDRTAVGENSVARETLSKIDGTEGFGRSWSRALARELPSQYLESMTGNVQGDEPVEARGFDTVISSVGWYDGESFKMSTARSTAQGTRLIAAQHGAGYGMFRSHPLEDHERAVSDEFWSWGWGDGNGKIRNVPSPLISSFVRAWSKGGADSRKIVYVATCHPRYLYRFHSTPIAGQWTDYKSWMDRFLTALPERLRPSFRMRLYAHDYDRGWRQELESSFPWLQWADRLGWPGALTSNDVLVVDHPGTAFLEAVAAKAASVFFWRRDQWEFTSEAERLLDGLKTSGAWHETPESAAAKLADIADDPSPWWESPEIIKARTAFTERFALHSQDWSRAWALAAQDRVAGGRGKVLHE